MLYQINDDWHALITQSYQSIDAEGVFWEEEYDSQGKAVPDLSVEQYGPSYDKDKFENTAWTLDGRIAALHLMYTGVIPGPQRRPVAGLHQLLARPLRRLLPMQLSRLSRSTTASTRPPMRPMPA